MKAKSLLFAALAPGVYTVKVTIDGKQTVRTVVKL